MKKFEKSTDGNSCGGSCNPVNSNAQTDADDAELDKLKKQASALIDQMKTTLKANNDKTGDKDSKDDKTGGKDSKGEKTEGSPSGKAATEDPKKEKKEKKKSPAEITEEIEATIKKNIKDKTPAIAKAVSGVLKNNGIKASMTESSHLDEKIG